MESGIYIDRNFKKAPRHFVYSAAYIEMTFLNLQHKIQLDNSEHNITIVVPQDVTFLKEAIF